ncbi:nitroreductase family protein, partial [Veillonella atypica]|uniref:nitroreductase family protein n=2 Tax=Bacillota TaxID=1239 RepID=UPI001D089BD9
MNNDFKDIMQNRKSIRHYDSSVKISRDELLEIINESISAPSACNLQSWYFVIVDTPEGKKKLHDFLMPF